MRQERTQYRLVVTDADLAAIARFQREQGEESSPLAYPSVIAERDGVIVGLLGTTPTVTWTGQYSGVLLIGPMTVARALLRPAIVALRLVQIYESLLEVAGVRGAVWITNPDDHRWARLLTRLGFAPYAHTSAGNWYAKRIGITPILRVA